MTISNLGTIDKIIDIISALSPSNTKIQPNTMIIEQGIIDSLSVFNILVNLEKAFNIKIATMDATIDDFQSPESIASLVEKIQQR